MTRQDDIVRALAENTAAVNALKETVDREREERRADIIRIHERIDENGQAVRQLQRQESEDAGARKLRRFLVGSAITLAGGMGGAVAARWLQFLGSIK